MLIQCGGRYYISVKDQLNSLLSLLTLLIIIKSISLQQSTEEENTEKAPSSFRHLTFNPTSVER